MPKPYADAQAHNSIPDTAVPCILARRHLGFPPLHEQRRELVRIRFGDGRGDFTDFVEYVARCSFCGTQRTMRRDRAHNTFTTATYDYGEGYAPPAGTVWDRDALYGIYAKRHPVPGKPRVIDLR